MIQTKFWRMKCHNSSSSWNDLYPGAHCAVLFFAQVSNILSTLETILTKGEVQSVVVEYEALNVIIR